MKQIGPLNPPPPASTLQSGNTYSNVRVVTSNYRGPFPILSPYTDTITSTTDIDMGSNPFTYIKAVVDTFYIELNLTNINIGMQFVVEVDGWGYLILNDIDSNHTLYLYGGTFLLVKFKDFVRLALFNNPLAIP